jgi:hypothetical protein
VSQDPIGLLGGNPSLYGHVPDSNAFSDLFGLQCLISIVKGLSKKVPNSFKKIFKCKEYAQSLKKMMEKKGIAGELLELKSLRFIWSNKLGKNIAENGEHMAIKVDDMIFDNLNPDGIKFEKWAEDLGIDLPGMARSSSFF